MPVKIVGGCCNCGAAPSLICCASPPSTLYLSSTQGTFTLTSTAPQVWRGCRVTTNAVPAGLLGTNGLLCGSVGSQIVAVWAELKCVIVSSVARWELRFGSTNCSQSGVVYPMYSDSDGVIYTCANTTPEVNAALLHLLIGDVYCSPVFGEFTFSNATFSPINQIFSVGDTFTLTE